MPCHVSATWFIQYYFLLFSWTPSRVLEGGGGVVRVTPRILAGIAPARPGMAGAWKEMQERYLSKVLGPGDGTRRVDGRPRRVPARAPMEVSRRTCVRVGGLSRGGTDSGD
jgi:hypothetical protein